MTAPQTDPRPLVIVRHGSMRRLGLFAPPPAYTLDRDRRVIVRTDRGVEVGDPLAVATPQAAATLPDPSRGDLLRAADAADLQKIDRLLAQQAEAFAAAERLIAHHRLPMKLVDAELLFGGERAVFYFLADSRVDFRELVRSMAREFHTRIELRQVGPRDEARVKADYGDCGRPVCCNTFLAVMPPVSMRMAKLQKATLDPNKISGRCGRLKCCLRYEQDVYEAHLQDLPAVGARVLTRTGAGRVLAQETLARRLLVEFEDGRRLPVAAGDILTEMKPTPRVSGDGGAG
jgi:cell fate regulator YaaT (PSP1 superfamily)